MAPKDAPVSPDYHLAIIMDGNGRWAKMRGLPRVFGHRAGAERVREIVEACPDLGVRFLTLYAFSTENWKRSTEEVLSLMSLLRRYIEDETEKLNAKGVRVRFLGSRDRLDRRLVRMMGRLEASTRHNDRLHLSIAVNYGGRDEITRTVRSLVAEVLAGRLDPSEIDEAAVAGCLDTRDLPDPDLVIRSSGEFRVSNFLPWQSAYSEYVFTRTLWPDFTPRELSAILLQFAGRERRFGAVAV